MYHEQRLLLVCLAKLLGSIKAITEGELHGDTVLWYDMS
jgi:hypothetical protein